MTTDDELAIDTEGESVRVVGADTVGREVAGRIAESDVRATDSGSSPDAVMLAVDGARVDPDSAHEFPPLPEAAVRLAVVAIPEQPTADERAVLSAVGSHVGTTVLISGGADDLAAAVATLVSIVRDPGIVNVDLADVETVFRPIELATLAVGSGPIDDPAAVVRDAFESLPRGVETDAANGVLVDLVGPPRMSVADVNEAVSTVRGRVGPDAHVIWGGSVDAALETELEVRLVFAGVESVRVASGDDCPRCGTPLSTYTLDGRTMLSCEACGFADLSVRLRE